MKKTLLVALLLTGLASTSALANQVKLVAGYGPFSANQAGEFTIVPMNTSFNASAYVNGVTKNVAGYPGTFQTFCLERHTTISAGATYDATPNQMTSGTGFQLNKGVARLYTAFAAGTLADYDYGAGRLASAAALQNAIWYLLGGQIAAPIGNVFVDAAMADADWAEANDDMHVKVLNLTRITDGADRQDIIVITGGGVPDGGLTLALLGMGLTGLGLVSRRVRK